VIRQAGRSARTSQSGALGTREKWGYGFWLFLGLVFGVPESWAGLASPPWPSLTDTVGHLDTAWPPARVVVAAVVVFVAFYFVRVPVSQAGSLGPGRTYNGRLSGTQGNVSPLPALIYIPLALGAITAGSVIAAVTSGSWALGYVIYGLIAVFLVIVPNVLAYWFAREVPWPTLLTTVTDLERRWRLAAVVVLAGLVILLLHLALYPWPDLG
jgi:hypothetical protein